MSVGSTAIVLPSPSAHEWDCQLHAPCRGADSAVFFSPHAERGRARKQRWTAPRESAANARY